MSNRAVACNLIPTFALLVAIVLLAVACNSGDEDVPREHGEDETASPVLTGLSYDPNRMLAEVAQEVPGFAGYSADPQDDHVYIIYSTRQGIDVEAVKDAVVRRDPSRAQAFNDATFRIEAVQWDADDLYSWYQEVGDVVIFELPSGYRDDIGFWDLDELNNRVVAAFTTEEARAWAQQQVSERIDAPPGAILVILTSPAYDDIETHSPAPGQE